MVSVATVSRGAGTAFTASIAMCARAIASSHEAVNPAGGPAMRAAAAPIGSSSAGRGFTAAGAAADVAVAFGAGAGALAQASSARAGRARARRIGRSRGKATLRQGPLEGRELSHTLPERVIRMQRGADAALATSARERSPGEPAHFTIRAAG